MIRSVHYTRCARRLAKGEVKRVPMSGALVGYHVACPGCGLVRQYLAEEAGWTEATDALGVGIINATRPPKCVICRKVIVVIEGRLTVA
jgi:hypothetical protein